MIISSLVSLAPSSVSWHFQSLGTARNLPLALMTAVISMLFQR